MAFAVTGSGRCRVQVPVVLCFLSARWFFVLLKLLTRCRRKLRCVGVTFLAPTFRRWCQSRLNRCHVFPRPCCPQPRLRAPLGRLVTPFTVAASGLLRTPSANRRWKLATGRGLTQRNPLRRCARRFRQTFIRQVLMMRLIPIIQKATLQSRRGPLCKPSGQLQLIL